MAISAEFAATSRAFYLLVQILWPRDKLTDRSFGENLPGDCVGGSQGVLTRAVAMLLKYDSMVVVDECSQPASSVAMMGFHQYPFSYQ